MRGRWASVAIGAHVARSRAGAQEQQQAQAAQTQQQASQQQIEAQQRQIEAHTTTKTTTTTPIQPQQEDVTQQLQKYADLHQKGILSDEEFQKLKADLLSKM